MFLINEWLLNGPAVLNAQMYWTMATRTMHLAVLNTWFSLTPCTSVHLGGQCLCLSKFVYVQAQEWGLGSSGYVVVVSLDCYMLDSRGEE
jgi:hypothetical protein